MSQGFDPKRFQELADAVMCQPREARTIDYLLGDGVRETVLKMVDAGRTYIEMHQCMREAGLRVGYQAFAKAMAEFMALAQQPSRKDRIRRLRQEALTRRLPAVPQSAAPVTPQKQGSTSLPTLADRRQAIGRSTAELQKERLQRS